jgi:hypothetical protein
VQIQVDSLERDGKALTTPRDVFDLFVEFFSKTAIGSRDEVVGNFPHRLSNVR